MLKKPGPLLLSTGMASPQQEHPLPSIVMQMSSVPPCSQPCLGNQPASMQQTTLGSLSLLNILHLVFYRQSHFYNTSCPRPRILGLSGLTLQPQPRLLGNYNSVADRPCRMRSCWLSQIVKASQKDRKAYVKHDTCRSEGTAYSSSSGCS